MLFFKLSIIPISGIIMVKQWIVNLSAKAGKTIKEKNAKKALPQSIIDILQTLIMDLEQYGPTLGTTSIKWHNFGPIAGKKDVYHCHLKKGKPTYVACWCIEDKKIKLLEIFYVGTHENAPY